MSAFTVIYILLITSSIPVYAQICIWGATSQSSSIINGEYTTSTTINGEPAYSKSLPSNCGMDQLHLYNDHDGNGRPSWCISHSTSIAGGLAICSVNVNAFTTNPSICDNNWQISNTIDPSITARTGPCPSWNCKRIQITYSQGDDWCGMTYDQHIAPNAWSGYNTKYNQQMYFYFNELYMRWFCAPKYLKDCNVTYYDRSTNPKEFIDLSIGNTLQIPMWYNSQTATVTCLDSVSTPTVSAPTASPMTTQQPSTTNKVTTQAPTDRSTIASTVRTTEYIEITEGTQSYVKKQSESNTPDYTMIVVIGVILCIGGVLLGYCCKRVGDKAKLKLNETNMNISVTDIQRKNESVDIDVTDKDIVLTQNELIIQKMKEMYTVQLPKCVPMPAQIPVMSNSFVDTSNVHRQMATGTSELQLEGTFSKHQKEATLLCEQEGDFETVFEYLSEEEEQVEKHRVSKYVNDQHCKHKSDAQSAIALNDEQIKYAKSAYNKAGKALPINNATLGMVNHNNAHSEIGNAYPMNVTPKGGNINVYNAKKAYPMSATKFGYQSNDENDSKSEFARGNSTDNGHAFPIIRTNNGCSEKAYPMNVKISKGGYNEQPNALPTGIRTSKGGYDNDSQNKMAYPMNVTTKNGEYSDRNLFKKSGMYNGNRFNGKALPVSDTKGGVTMK